MADYTGGPLYTYDPIKQVWNYNGPSDGIWSKYFENNPTLPHANPPAQTPNTQGMEPATTQMMLDPNVAASDPRALEAQLVRAQWEDFSKNALPIRSELERMTTYNGNPGVVTALKAEGVKDANTAFDNTVGAASRDTARLGMAMTEGEKSTLARAASLGKTAAIVDNSNRVDQFQQDLNRSIVAGTGMNNGIKI